MSRYVNVAPCDFYRSGKRSPRPILVIVQQKKQFRVATLGLVEGQERGEGKKLSDRHFRRVAQSIRRTEDEGRTRRRKVVRGAEMVRNEESVPS